MTNETQQFYFDEAGYTGNNLLDHGQPFFVYAGVAMKEEHALDIRNETRSRFRLTAQELKGASLIKSMKGRKALSWLLAETSPYSHVMVANKEYALAAKFYEHIFEPALSEGNSLFYATGFHKFIATFLHVCHRAADANVDSVLRNFARMMRNMDSKQLGSVLSPLDQVDQSNPLGMILAFALCHQNRIKREIETMSGSEGIANWPLEMSMTALHWLLASWGEEFDELEVYCDVSQPIHEARDFLDIFIGREDKLYLTFGDQPSPSFVYNLAGPVNLIDSKASPGVQIADVLSSTIAYAHKNPDERHAIEWMDILKDVLANQIVPDKDDIDLTKERAYVNSLILQELVNRSVKGHDLVEGMDQFASISARLFPKYLEEIGLPYR